MKDEEMAEEYKETVHRWRDSKGELVQEEDVAQAFLDGLKASRAQWHYPAKSEYPKDDTDVLVAYYSRFCLDTKQPSGELQCKIAGYLGKKWFDTSTECSEIDDWLNKPNMVYAWKEIVLPKEIEK